MGTCEQVWNEYNEYKISNFFKKNIVTNFFKSKFFKKKTWKYFYMIL
jgi:hypothetical protein